VTLHARLSAALDEGGRPDRALVAATDRPDDRRDRFLTLLDVYDLHTAPLEQLGDRVLFQQHPGIARLKGALEAEWLAELEVDWVQAGALGDVGGPEDVQKAMRVLAARDRVHPAYRWLADEASWDELLRFLALEGGPDGGFDDLVAACQIGLSGSAKLELGKNYWDEMGGGDPDAVHTVLHQRLAAAVGLQEVPREQLPVEALERTALGGLLATNRWLQPEMVGALGLLELQAGPRCRLVLQALDRLEAPEEAYPFYVEHAEVDPVHGKDWVEKAIVPLAHEHPGWGPRMVRGAFWRSAVNARFFVAVHEQLVRPIVSA